MKMNIKTFYILEVMSRKIDLFGITLTKHLIFLQFPALTK